MDVKISKAFSSYIRPSPILGDFAFSELLNGVSRVNGVGWLATVDQISDLFNVDDDSEFVAKFIEIEAKQVSYKLLSGVNNIVYGSRYDTNYISFDCLTNSGVVYNSFADFRPLTFLSYSEQGELNRTPIINSPTKFSCVSIESSDDYVNKITIINTFYTYIWNIYQDDISGNRHTIQFITNSAPTQEVLLKCFGVSSTYNIPRLSYLGPESYAEIRIYDDFSDFEPFKLTDLRETETSAVGGDYITKENTDAYLPGQGSVNPDNSVVPTDGPYTPGYGGGTTSGTGGGGGNFGIDPSTGQPVQSDDIVPSLPGIGSASGSYEGSVANAGLFVHYAMNAPILEKVGSWLWTSDLGLVIAKEFMSILYGSPIESAISLMSYPFNITALSGVVSNMQRIVWGSQQLTDTLGDIRAPAITNPYATIDWGTVQLTEFWGNFLDYAPHTKLELYLPWCTGFVPIDPNECLPGSLRVVTNIELAKGTCLHNVIGNDGRVIATHTGTCGKQLPLTALDTSGKALSMITAAVSTAVAGSAGAAATRAGEIAYGNYLAGARQLGLSPGEAVTGGHVVRQEAMAPHIKNQNRARNMALAGSAAAARVPSSVHRNGSFTGSTAGLGVQYPYLIISRPTQSVPKQYGHHYGYPSNIYTSLLTLRGYTEIGEIHLTGFTCTDDELSEIDSLLKSGVIL